MIDTRAFRTKSIEIETTNPTVNEYWPIALDIGYSSVKGFSPNTVYCFPSYAKNLGRNPVLYGDIQPDEILYRDGDTGDIWRVGASAQKMVSDRDTDDSQLELYGRDRYFTPMYKVLVETGLALGILNNEKMAYNGKPIYVQTGLPPAYMDDKDDITGVISGTHHFAVKTAKTGTYINFNFQVPEKNISVMSQPEGTLMSVATDNNAASIPDARKYFQSNVVIFDAGFGTLDLFTIENRRISSRETFNEYGMKAVIQKTAEKIRKKYGVTIRASVMQNSLEDGTITVKKRDGMKVSSRKEPFGDMLEESVHEVCREAVEKIMNLYSGLFDYNYLILTGGTAAAWQNEIRQYFADVDGLTVLPGNVNCPDLDMIFTNVRGYYMFMINTLRRLERKKGMEQA